MASDGSAASRGDDCIARARALVPLIEAAASEIETTREIPAAVLSALHAAGMFRLLLPRSLGGAELSPAAYIQVIEAIATADASVAWCLGQGSGCSMSAAYLEPEIARAVFGGADAVLAWGPAGGNVKATAVSGGYRVSGTWNFASGSRHATWLGGHCVVHEADGAPRLSAQGKQAERTLLFPKAKATIRDVWQVMGLKGTGSNSYTVEDLFVPDAYTLTRDTPAERREAGVLYRFTTVNIYASSFAAVALGIARATLAAFITLAQAKTPTGVKSTLRDNAVIQSQVALAEVKLRSARLFLLQSLRDTEAALATADSLTLDQRVTLRMASTHAIHQAKEVVDACYHAAGATAIFMRNPFERRFRDVHTVSQQIQGHFSLFEVVGQHLLGLHGMMRGL